MTACCDTINPHHAIIIGIVAALFYIKVSTHISDRLKIDDPLEASTVHGACGILGTLFVAILGKNDEGVAYYSSSSILFKQLGVQLIGCIAIILWSGFWSYMFFSISQKYKVLKYRTQEELIGGDVINFRLKPQDD